MAHVVQVTLAQEPSHSSLDLNKYVKDVVLFLIYVDNKDNDNVARNLKKRQPRLRKIKIFDKPPTQT